MLGRELLPGCIELPNNRVLQQLLLLLLLSMLASSWLCAPLTTAVRREELASGKERELQRREAALAGAEQRVAQLTRRLELDLAATPSAAATSQLRGSFSGFGSGLQSASSVRTAAAPAPPAASVSKPPPSFYQKPQQAQQQPQQQQQQQQQQAAAASSGGLPSSGTFATPASSLLQRSSSFDMQPPHGQQQQQQAPNSVASTAAGGVSAFRRDSFASMDGTPERQAGMGGALKQLQAATDKGAHRWGGGVGREH